MRNAHPITLLTFTEISLDSTISFSSILLRLYKGEYRQLIADVILVVALITLCEPITRYRDVSQDRKR